MPTRILKKHGVIEERGDLVSLTVGPSTTVNARRSGDSPVAGHLLVVPFRHVPDFLALTADGRRAWEDLLRVLGQEVLARALPRAALGITRP